MLLLSKSNDMQNNSTPWKLWRWVLFRMLSRSAFKVLSTHEVNFADGTHVRWFKSDITRFLGETRILADDIRPVARLHMLPSVGNRMMVELAIFTVAAHRALLRNSVDKKQAKQLVADVGWDIYARMLRIWSWPFRAMSRDPGVRLRNTIRLLLIFPFSARGAPGYAVETRIEGEGLLTYFTHCPPQSFVRALIAERGDEGDLEAFNQSWCNYDWPVADTIASDGRRGHYRRDHTMSLGDNVCDMCWGAHCPKNQPQEIH